MNILFNKLKRIIKQIAGLFPTALPVGVSEFHAWAEDISKTYDLPTSNLETVKFTLATMIMHLGPQAAYKTKIFFVLSLRAGAAKQIAHACFVEIKTKQQEESEATAKALAAASSELKQ